MRTEPDPKFHNADHPFWNRFERFIEPFEDTDRKVLPKTAWGFIGYFAAQAKGPFILMLVVGALMGAVEASLYWGVGYLIDVLDSATPATLLIDHGIELAFMLFLILVVRAAVMIAAAVVEQQVIVPRFYTMVRWQSFRRVIQQPYAFYQDDFAGRIATKILQAGQSVGDFIVTSLQSLWSFMTFIVLTAGVLAALDAWMGVVVAVWFVGYVMIVRYLLPRLRAAGKNNANESAVLNGRLVDIFTNILTVKLFDTGDREHSDVKTAIGNYMGSVTHMTRVITLVRMSVAILNGIMMSAVGVIAVMGWMNGTITTGAIAATMGLVFRLNQMSGWMMFNINGLIRAYSTVQDAVETISVDPKISDKPNALVLSPVKGRIRFENVTFNYDKSDTTLFRTLDLDIKAGEKVGIVGPSGAGKSTLISLLLRLFEPETGRVLIDDHDIQDVTQASLRAQFGVVSQDPALLHRSLADNIAYGHDGASRAQIEEAAQRAKAYDFILDARDPRGRKGFNAHVGERGIKLSGGQRQRIAIARVMLKDAPVLILDEATSALDSEIEAAIQENLGRLMQDKTVLAIAHRLSTISQMDRLIVLDGGQIVQMGTHDALLQEKQGLYARLWARQSGGFIAVDETAG
ncbi:ABC transporter ATP-binding protein [Ahrensia sp. 13_GOM-1096m]|uniref:ABC transporter ATP-binding protein n=1 Tax=Ahrensia sp. 13_GOM-1096m TaxID=1380380 RepID=UPI00047EABC0|nr:ABC transporter ATP-binding protein [Ahrensia sp. 13_GOM-1096m]